jgi:hypothetical protein
LNDDLKKSIKDSGINYKSRLNPMFK